MVGPSKHCLFPLVMLVTHNIPLYLPYVGRILLQKCTSVSSVTVFFVIIFLTHFFLLQFHRIGGGLFKIHDFRWPGFVPGEFVLQMIIMIVILGSFLSILLNFPIQEM
jgi:hypothetical protein